MNKLEWTSREEGYYNAYKPEFQLLFQEDEEDDRLAGEFYVYSQTNSRFFYKNIKIMCNTTVLDKVQLVSLDSGRYITPVPTWGFIGKDEHLNPLYTYKYYLKNSFDFYLQQFLFDNEDSEEVWAKRRYDEVVLYFSDDNERLMFEHFVLGISSLMNNYIKEADEHYYEIDSSNPLEVTEARKRLSMGLALNKALSKYRSEQYEA